MPTAASSAPAADVAPLPAATPHTLSSHHNPVHEPEVPLVVQLPSSSPETKDTKAAKPAARAASLALMKGKLKTAATKIIHDRRITRKPSALFSEVVKEHRTSSTSICRL